MPFQSEAQRRFMFAQHPRIAKRWAKETPKGKDLPEKKTDSDPEETKDKAEAEKEASVRKLGLQLGLVKIAKPKAEEILNLEGASGIIPDFLLGSMHSNRTGRAKALAKAIGYDKKEIPLVLRHPNLTDGLAMLVGAGTGRLLGSVLGGSGDTGGLLGSGLGGVAGPLLKRWYARKKMKEIMEQFNEHTDAKIFDVDPEVSTLRSLFYPMGGFQAKGESDAARFLAGKTRNAPSYHFGDYLNYVPAVSGLSLPITGMLQGLEAASNMRRDAAQNKKQYNRALEDRALIFKKL